jgi:hypothetical protein
MLVAVSAAHGRHAVTRAWAEHTASLDFDAVYVAVSEGDTENYHTCVDHGFIAWYMTNDPLSAKFNSALSEAMVDGAERIAIVPSDDLISRQWVAAMRESEVPYCYPHTCGIFDAYTQNAYKITKLSFGTLKYGAGRVVSRRVVEACGGTLWPENHNRGLDGASHEIIKRAGFTHTVVETPGIPITDVKTKDNLWAYATWLGSGSNITPDEALHMCSPSVRAQIDALKQ